MRADPEDQLDQEWQREKPSVFKWLLLVAVLAGLLAYWYWSDGVLTPAEVPTTPVATDTSSRAEVPATPDIPQRPEPVVIEEALIETDDESIDTAMDTPAPAPMAPDDLLRRQLDIAGADANLSALVSNQNTLEVSAALIDGMSRGVLMRKLLPVDPPKQAFEVVEEDDVLYMSPKNYTRYDRYANSIASLDSEILVNGFHTLRPLYESTYEQLGLESGDFDNAVIRSLDVILATPEIDEPIELTRKSVMYSYADPELEALPAVQKLLLRMGPDNVRRIKQKAQAIRAGLLSE